MREESFSSPNQSQILKQEKTAQIVEGKTQTNKRPERISKTEIQFALQKQQKQHLQQDMQGQFELLKRTTKRPQFPTQENPSFSEKQKQQVQIPCQLQKTVLQSSQSYCLPKEQYFSQKYKIVIQQQKQKSCSDVKEQIQRKYLQENKNHQQEYESARPQQPKRLSKDVKKVADEPIDRQNKGNLSINQTLQKMLAQELERQILT